VTFGSLLLGDKSPLFIAIALTIFGWYVDSISKYFTDQAIIYVSPTKTADRDGYLITNVSLSKPIENVRLLIKCVSSPDCLAAMSDKRFGQVEQIAPFAAAGNQTCFDNEDSYQAEVSLPPGASARIVVKKKSGGKTSLFLVGRSEQPCDQDMKPVQMRVEEYPSAIAFLLQNFILYYFISIVVLILVFVITLWRLTFRATPTPGEDKENVTQAFAIDLTIHSDRQLRPEQSG
jgi:hypothetical protein